MWLKKKTRHVATPGMILEAAHHLHGESNSNRLVTWTILSKGDKDPDRYALCHRNSELAQCVLTVSLSTNMCILLFTVAMLSCRNLCRAWFKHLALSVSDMQKMNNCTRLYMKIKNVEEI